MIELDALDKKLIQLLENNANQSNAKIAKTLKVSPMTIRRRINRLLKGKVFRIHAIPDPAYLGVGISAAFTLKVDKKRINDLISILRVQREIVFMARSVGRFDIYFWAWFDSTEQLSSFIETTVDPLEGILDMQVSVFTSIKKYWRVPIG
jgi:DNA-binding Lrp family transcriptional regulator